MIVSEQQHYVVAATHAYYIVSWNVIHLLCAHATLMATEELLLNLKVYSMAALEDVTYKFTFTCAVCRSSH